MVTVKSILSVVSLYNQEAVYSQVSALQLFGWEKDPRQSFDSSDVGSEKIESLEYISDRLRIWVVNLRLLRTYLVQR